LKKNKERKKEKVRKKEERRIPNPIGLFGLRGEQKRRR